LRKICYRLPLDKASRNRHGSPTLKTPAHNYLSWRIWSVYAVLFGIAVPWYWPAEDARMLVGLPLWVVVSVAGSFGISCFTAWLLVARWPADEEDAA